MHKLIHKLHYKTNVQKFVLACTNGKGDEFPVHAKKAYRGKIGIAPFIINLSTGWR
jgi:hypothetical protein